MICGPCECGPACAGRASGKAEPGADAGPAARAAGRLDPATGELLTEWDDALAAIGPHDDPMHVARFGTKFDAQGVLAGSRDAGRCIGYLTKYLTKQLGGCHHPDTGTPAGSRGSPDPERFPRRLIAERRIQFVRIGRHVRIPESALREFIAAGMVEPVTARRCRRAA